MHQPRADMQFAEHTATIVQCVDGDFRPVKLLLSIVVVILGLGLPV